MPKKQESRELELPPDLVEHLISLGPEDAVAYLLDVPDLNLSVAEAEDVVYSLLQEQHLSAELAQELLRRGASLDLQDDYGTTVLMYAALNGREEAARALLDAGADAELVDKNGMTALQKAEQNLRTAVAEMLRQHAAAQ